MADNYTRQSDTFRAKDKSGIKSPVTLVGAHTRTYKGIESIACVDTVVHNLTVPSGADFAEITFEGASATTDFIRYWHSATDPTSTVGVKLKDGETVVSANPGSFTAIRGSTGGGGTLRVEYFSYE